MKTCTSCNQQKEFKEFKYKDAPIMNNGNSELFIVDVLKLDDGNMQH